MLQRSLAALGRWGSRDFLRGRSKRGGAIHTRHTHGSKGRFKRLSTLHGLRDGRRHAQNRLSGGLGIKLGGGLFGLRIPRQHALSTLTKEEYDVEVYGHPNITNPYRDHLDEHPSLQAVMANASIALQLVVLLPRVSRRALHDDATNGASSSSSSSSSSQLPQSWMKLNTRLMESLRLLCCTTTDAHSPLAEVLLHYCTLQASTSVEVLHGSKLNGSDEDLRALTALYDDHRRGLKLIHDTHRGGTRKFLRGCGAHAQLFGSALRPSLAATALGGYTSSAMQMIRAADAASHAVTDVSGVAGRSRSRIVSGTVLPDGVQAVLRRLYQDFPNSVRVCVRDEPHGLKDAESSASSSSPTQVLLVKDVDPDEVGVWKTSPLKLPEVMRWEYARNDPRAHNADALAHDQRRLPLTIFVDASKPMRSSAAHPRRRQRTSLLPHHVAEELGVNGFHPLVRQSLESTLAELRVWAPQSQWQRWNRSEETSC